jgi:mannose-6-phosphate isomerase-like protein (cupin superfamily)
MQHYTLSDLVKRQEASGSTFYEPVDTPDITVGLYALDAGAVDDQDPHTEDEVYVILEGRARMTVGDETCDVGPGDTVFVPAGTPHLYHDITEDLRIVYVFAPGWGRRAG